MTTLKKGLPLLIFALAVPLMRAQTPPDCSFTFTFTGNATQTAVSNLSGNTPCVNWRITFSTTETLAATVTFQTSPDGSSWTSVPNAICSSADQTSCIVQGTNPLTGTRQGMAYFTSYGNFVRLSVSTTGTGTGTARGYGAKGASANARIVNSSSSGPTGPAGPSSIGFGYTFTLTAGVYSARNNVTGIVDYSGADAGPVIRSAIANNSTVCGHLYFTAAVYNINSLVHETTGSFGNNWYGIGFPGQSSTTTTCEWIVEGDSSPTFVYPTSSGTPQPTVPNNGVVFNITPTALGTVSSTNQVLAFWSRPTTTVTFTGQGAWVSYKHLGVRFPDNQRGHETHIDCSQSNVCNMDGVITDFDIPFNSLLTPAVPETYGIVTTQGAEAGGQIIQTYSIGDYVGFDIQGEHAILINSYPIRAVYGINWGVRGGNAINHGMTWIHPGWAECIHGLTIGSLVPQYVSLDITNMVIEEATASYAPNFQPVYRAKEINPGFVSGRISYYRVVAMLGTFPLPGPLFDGGGGTRFQLCPYGSCLGTYILGAPMASNSTLAGSDGQWAADGSFAYFYDPVHARWQRIAWDPTWP